jgi:hypothetical protein
MNNVSSSSSACYVIMIKWIRKQIRNEIGYKKTDLGIFYTNISTEIMRYIIECSCFNL